MQNFSLSLFCFIYIQREKFHRINIFYEIPTKNQEKFLEGKENFDFTGYKVSKYNLDTQIKVIEGSQMKAKGQIITDFARSRSTKYNQ